jgi:hypothetical protein
MLDPKHAAFIGKAGISINVASCAEGRLPRLARATGCRVSEDGCRVSLLVAGSQYAPLIEAVRQSRTVAAVFSFPSTHETIQLKATDAEVQEPAPGDLGLVDRYVDAFAAELEQYGYSGEAIRAVLWCDPAELRVIAFTPTAAFLQTPGPRAGAPLPA